MKDSKIKKIVSLVETKFIGLFDVEYKNKLNKTGHWMVASRKKKEELEDIYLNNKEDKIDAVVICALHKSSNKLVLIRQFRVPINDYIYELPAGLVDNDELIKETVRRELKEETGLSLLSVYKNISKEKIYLSPGMSDESAAFIYCICDGEISDEFLEEEEDIEAILVSQREAKEILDSTEKIDIKALLILKMFVNLGDKMFK